MALTLNPAGSFDQDYGNNVLTTLNAQQNSQQLTTKNVIGELTDWFGPLENRMRVDPYSSQPVTTYHLPDVFRGRSLFMRDTIVGLVTNWNEWYTTLALPWLQTNEQHFTWTEFKFNNTLAGVVPPEGVPRLLTSSSSTFQRGTERRGLAFLLEAEFYKTEQGQEMYRRNFRGIRDAIQETANLGVCAQISSAHDRYRNLNKAGGNMGTSYAALTHVETNNFAIVNKSDNGVDLMIGRIKDAMGMLGVRPDMMIVPIGFKRYYAQVKPERSQYIAWGPNGELQLREGPEIAGSIGGIRLVEARRMVIDEGAPAVDPFLKVVRTGTVVPLVNDIGTSSPETFKSHHRDIDIWDETCGKYVTLTLRDAVLNCFRWDEEGELRREHDDLAKQSPDELSQLHVLNHPTTSVYNPKMLSRDMEEVLKSRVTDHYRDMFLFKNGSKFEVCTLFGLFEQMTSTNVDFRLIAEMAASKIFRDSGMAAARSALIRLKEIVSQSEMMPYSNQFWLAVLRLNATSPRQNGRFMQNTNSDLAQHWRQPPIPEMAPNAFGYLDMPPKSMDPSFSSWSVLPHLNSWPAIQTVIAMEGTQSGWDPLIEDLKKAVNVIKDMVQRCKEVFGTSMLLNSLNRPPWFQKDDVETVFVHNVILQPRHAVFMRIPGNVGFEEAVESTPERFFDPDEIHRGRKWNLERRQGGGRPNDVVEHEDGYRSRDGEPMFTTPAPLPTFDGDTGSEVFIKDVAGRTPEFCNSVDVLASQLESHKPGSKKKLFDTVAALAMKNFPSENWAKKDELDVVNRASKITYTLCQVALAKGVQAASEKLDLFSALTSSNASEKDLANATRQVNALMAAKIAMTRVPASGASILEPFGTYDLADRINKEQQAAIDNYAAQRKGGVPSGNVVAEKGKETGVFEKNLDNFSVGENDWGNGFWVRAPIGSYKKFVETCPMKFPLARPSDPTTGHLSALSPVFNGNGKAYPIDPNGYQPVLAQTVPIASLSVSDALVNWDFPEEIKSVAGFDGSRSSKRPFSIASELGDEPRSGAATFSSLGSTGSGIGGLMSAMKKSSSLQSGAAASNEEGVNSFQHEGSRDYYPSTGALFSATPAGIAHTKKMETIMNQHRGGFRKSFPKSYDLLTSTVMKHRWNFGNTISNPVVRAFHQVFLLCANVLPQWLDLIDNDINPPCGALGWRLWITRSMYQMPVMVGGFSTGATPYGNTDVQLGADTLSKVLLANVTFYLTSVIINPVQVHVVEAAIANNYEYGNGSEIITKASSVVWGEKQPDGDIVFTLIPQTEKNFIEPMNLCGTHLAPNMTIKSMRKEDGLLHYSSAPYYTNIFSLSNHVRRLVQIEKEPRYGSDNHDMAQLVAYTDWHSKYNPTTNSRSSVYLPVNSHLGPNGSGPYAAQALRGLDVKFTPYNSYEHNNR
jgi:hypothetical protein